MIKRINQSRFYILGILCSLGSVAFQLPANSASLTILNSSFESPNTTTFVSTINDWQHPLSTGVFNIQSFPAAYGALAAPNGNQVAYSNGGEISQILAASLSANTKYTLTLSVGNRLDAPLREYSVALLAGTSTLAAAGISEVSPSSGTFEDLSFSYTSSDSNPLIGQNLGINILTQEGPFTKFGQVNFDNIRLTAIPKDVTAVPEPSTILGSLFMIGFGICLKRKRDSEKIKSYKFK